jgi:dCTP deaminase
MAVLGKSEIKKLVEKYKVVHPFNEELLEGESYVLTTRDETTLKYLEHKNLISNEIVFIPPSYAGFLTAKSRFGRLGLSFLNAVKVDSGFCGRLALELVNLSNDRCPISIKKGEPLVHLVFLTRLGEPSPYAGIYNFQYTTDDEAELYK